MLQSDNDEMQNLRSLPFHNPVERDRNTAKLVNKFRTVVGVPPDLASSQLTQVTPFDFHFQIRA